MSVNTKMTAIAEEIRELSGTSNKMGLDDMKTSLGEANYEVGSQTELLAQIASALEGKAVGVEQVTPVISVNSTNGLITVTAGAKSSTHQLAFQAAKTITPTTASQVAVSSGYYTGGDIVVAGDSNLVASNIKSGISIFGVNGTLVEGDSESGDASSEDALVAVTLSSYSNSRVTIIGNGAFAFARTLKEVDFPNVTLIKSSAFNNCINLTSARFPACKTVSQSAFANCSKLTTIDLSNVENIETLAFVSCYLLSSLDFPKLASIQKSAFYRCSELTEAKFTNISTINDHAFASCRKFHSLTLNGSSVCDLAASTAFASTPFRGYSTYFSGTPHIYVPFSLVEAYQTATNWTYYSSYFVGI